MIDLYVLAASGMSAEQLACCHSSTRRRAFAYALGLLIPMVSWAASSYIIASQLFMLDAGPSMLVSLLCTVVVYCVERLIMLSPDKWYVVVCRLFIAAVAAILVASAIDICLFAREIAGQIRADATTALVQRQYAARHEQELLVVQRKKGWEVAVARQNCEADGSCGSVRRSLGPIWRELDRQTKQFRVDYDKEVRRLEQMKVEQAAAIEALANSESVVREAGLLARIEALHSYNEKHEAARKTYLLLFLLIVALEGVVVLVKVAFGSTVDDCIEDGREALARGQLSGYLKRTLEPEGQALALIEQRA